MDTNLDGDGSSSDLDDINNDINGCIKSLDDDIEGPTKNPLSNGAPSTTQSSRSNSSSSSSSSSESSSSSSSKSSSKTSSSRKKSKEKDVEVKSTTATTPSIVTVVDKVLYPARLQKKSFPNSERSVKVQHRSRSRSRVSRSVKESGYRTDGSVVSDKSMKRRKSRAPSTSARTNENFDIDLDLRGLQLSTAEPSSSVKLTKKNVTLMARKNDTNNNTNNNALSKGGKMRPMVLNLELNRRLLEHKMDLNGKSGSSLATSCKLGFKGFKSSQSFQELTASSRIMAPSWTAEEKVSSKSSLVKYAKSLPRTIKSRRSSVASRAGSVRSVASTISRMKRATTPAVIKNNEYVVAQVAEITNSLAKCSISAAKNSRSLKVTKVIPTTSLKKKKAINKRRSKKKDGNEALPVAEDHKLPLKKRHYLITDEKTSNGYVVKRKRLKKVAPPGIFEPTEEHNDDVPVFTPPVFNIMSAAPELQPKESPQYTVDNILQKMENVGTKRKRRRANRTGFPTPKRPKKKTIIPDNVSESSSVVIQKRMKKSKPTSEKSFQSLSLRQLQLKQQKEMVELKTNQQGLLSSSLSTSPSTRTIRARAKSVCHVKSSSNISPPLVTPILKRKQRRQTIFVEHKDLITTQKVEEEANTDKTAKKRKRNMILEQETTSVEIKKTKTSECPIVKLIPKNVYNGDTQRRAFVGSLKGTKCRCAPNPCGESCLNRSMFIECDLGICGKNCTNTAIQTGGLLNKDVEKFKTEQKGFGVRTKKDIPKKTLILEYTGEVLFLETFRQRMQTIYKSDQHHYCLELTGGLVLDGHRLGSLCRYVNHSCKPNCGMAKIYVDGLPRMILQAEEDIPAGTELTYDYKFDNFEDMTPQQCFCGADTCRGTLSAQLKAPRRASLSLKECGDIFVKRGGRKERIASTCNKANSCFLMRNLRRVEKHHPDLMAYYRNVNNRLDDDPKIGFAFVSKSHENSPPATLLDARKDNDDSTILKNNEIETNPIVVSQPLSEQSQVLWQLCERLEKDHGSEIAEITIPPPPMTTKSVGFSNHDRISLPISFENIKENVKMGHYDLHPLLFHYNIKIFLDNAAKFWGVNCPKFTSMNLLKDAYKSIRTEMIDEITRVWSDEFFVNAMMDKGIKKPPKNRKKVIERQNDEEDIVNCHCGRFLEEGLMIQCQQCLTWQHVDCSGTDGKSEDYICSKCDGKPPQMEILKKDETTADGHQCYLTLMRGDLQLRVGDAVYVLRDIPIDATNSGGPRHTYETIGKVNYTECDIVRVETLYKDNNGEAHVLGHHYLRPNEVYHEPSRKFYTNELMRTSIFESIPTNLVIDTCWVLDPTTYFKGRPINSIEEHVYICEYKVDKAARVFSVIKKSSRHPISTKPYAFYKFEEQLRQKRNHLPHEIDHVVPKKIKKDHLGPKKKQPENESKVVWSPLPLNRRVRKSLSIKEKMKKLESCLQKLNSRSGNVTEKPKGVTEKSKDSNKHDKNNKFMSEEAKPATKKDKVIKNVVKAKRKPGRPRNKNN